jgi:hypothetical protein
MSLSLSYCQLIKIILAQIGGSPLQQAYTEISKGLNNITVGSGIPLAAEFAQIQALIKQVTNTLNQLSGDINAEQAIASQFLYNPVGTSLTASIGAIDHTLTTNPPSDPTDLANLQALRASLVTYKLNADVLTGASPPPTNAGFSGCTLADLLGTGCAPAGNVPDVDLQVLINGLKSGAVINAFTQQIELYSANLIGYPQLAVAFNNLQQTATNFNNTITNKINGLIIKRATEAFINNLVFNLLTGCSNELLHTVIQPNVLTTLQPFVTHMADQMQGGSATDAHGNPVTFTNTTLTTA